MKLWPKATLALLGAGLTLAGADAAQAKPEQPSTPRFASLKRELTNARVGPGLDYPIRWRYERSGLPVEIVASYGAWRQIRDSHGQGGWVNSALLRPTRTATVNPWLTSSLALRADPSRRATELAILRPNVLLRVRSCDLRWCDVRVSGRKLSGYVRQANLWGVYPDELIRANSIWTAFRRII